LVRKTRPKVRDKMKKTSEKSIAVAKERSPKNNGLV